MKTIIRKFASGLRLAYNKRESVRSVGIAVMCGVGSQNETDDTNGLSHFIEHTYFKGTTTRNAFQIVNEIESIGATINAYTSKQNTCYYTLSVDSDIEKCAEILSDIMFNAIFDKDELDKERKVIIEEINMSEDDNEDLCFDMLGEAYYGKNTALGRTILGPKENVERFNSDDVRKYLSENYNAKDIVISIVGNISFEKAVDIIERYFEGRFNVIENRVWRTSRLVTKPTYLYKYKDIEQANITIGMNGCFDTDKKKYANLVAHEIFGGGMSSRFFQEVREKNGLAYSVYSYNSAFANNAVTALYIGTNKKSAEKAVALTKNLIQSIRNEGLSQEEVQKGINSVRGHFVLGQESTSAMMRMVGSTALNVDNEFDLDESIDMINSLTRDDVYQAFLNAFDTSTASIAYVGREIKTDLLEVFNS